MKEEILTRSSLSLSLSSPSLLPSFPPSLLPSTSQPPPFILILHSNTFQSKEGEGGGRGGSDDGDPDVVDPDVGGCNLPCQPWIWIWIWMGLFAGFVVEGSKARDRDRDKMSE